MSWRQQQGKLFQGWANTSQDSTRGLGCLLCLSPTCSIPALISQDPSHREDTIKGNDGGEEENFLSDGHGVWDEGVVSRKESLFAYLQTYFGGGMEGKGLVALFSPNFKNETIRFLGGCSC